MSLVGSKKTIVLVVIALAVGLGFFLTYSDQGVVRLRELKRDRDRLKNENDELKELNRRLMLKIQKITADRKAIEDEARKKLGLIRPDETIYRFKDEPEAPPAGERK